jgi:acyl-CoA thioesterase II
VSQAVDDLIRLLDLEQIEVDIFRGVSPDDNRQRVFGGQVAGQALVAAGRTVERGDVHSLHAYFLRPGDPSVPILYEVDRIRDGRSFTTRRVVAVQHGKAIFNLSASFHVEEAHGLEHQFTMPEVAQPETLPTLPELLGSVSSDFADWLARRSAIDVRYIEPMPQPLRAGKHPPCQRQWFRAAAPLPDDPLLHACIVAYSSDLWLLDTALIPHDVKFTDPGFMGASLDHAMWFHRPFRADEWLLYDQESPTAHGARALARGTIFSHDGRLAVSVVQEGLTRWLTPPQAETPAG